MEVITLNKTSATVTTNKEIKPVIRVATFNIFSLGDIGSNKYNAQRDIIRRMGADFVGINEISDEDYTDILPTLMVETGYTYRVRGMPTVLGNAAISKYPLGPSTLIESTPPAAEMPTGVGIFKVKVNFKGKELLIYCGHFETWCMDAPCTDEIRPDQEFPRAIQIKRVIQDAEAEFQANNSLYFIKLGDHNDDDQSPETVEFLSEPAGVRGSFILGADITFPVPYAGYPVTQNNLVGMVTEQSTDLAGDRVTINVPGPNPGFVTAVRLDYIFTQASKINNLGEEIIFSPVDANTGLIKYGDILATNDSTNASDHRPIFADLELL